MALRFPVQSVFSKTSTDTTTTSYAFNLPTADIKLLVAKLSTANPPLAGTSPTCDVIIQTTDDGGTTWYDLAHFAQVTTSQITNAAALWMAIPVDGTAAVSNGYTGASSDGTSTASRVQGLPLLSRYVNVKFVYGGTVGTNNGITVKLYGVGQDNR